MYIDTDLTCFHIHHMATVAFGAEAQIPHLGRQSVMPAALATAGANGWMTSLAVLGGDLHLSTTAALNVPPPCVGDDAVDTGA